MAEAKSTTFEDLQRQLLCGRSAGILLSELIGCSAYDLLGNSHRRGDFHRRSLLRVIDHDRPRSDARREIDDDEGREELPLNRPIVPKPARELLNSGQAP